MSERSYPCEFCDTEELQEKKWVTVARQRYGEWFIFEDVPAWICPQCGHRYFDEAILRTIEGCMKTPPEDARPITAWSMSLSEKS